MITRQKFSLKPLSFIPFIALYLNTYSSFADTPCKKVADYLNSSFISYGEFFKGGEKEPYQLFVVQKFVLTETGGTVDRMDFLVQRIVDSSKKVTLTNKGNRCEMMIQTEDEALVSLFKDEKDTDAGWIADNDGEYAIFVNDKDLQILFDLKRLDEQSAGIEVSSHQQLKLISRWRARDCLVP